MDQSQEDQGIAKVIDSLASRFPTVPRSRVEQVVTESHSLLNGNPVRDYVPVLVERAAKDRLRRIVVGDPVVSSPV